MPSSRLVLDCAPAADSWQCPGTVRTNELLVVRRAKLVAESADLLTIALSGDFAVSNVVWCAA
jgi:hypothetical protein